MKITVVPGRESGHLSGSKICIDCTIDQDCKEPGHICKDGSCGPPICTNDDDCKVPGQICKDEDCTTSITTTAAVTTNKLFKITFRILENNFHSFCYFVTQ